MMVSEVWGSLRKDSCKEIISKHLLLETMEMQVHLWGLRLQMMVFFLSLSLSIDSIVYRTFRIDLQILVIVYKKPKTPNITSSIAVQTICFSFYSSTLTIQTSSSPTIFIPHISSCMLLNPIPRMSCYSTLQEQEREWRILSWMGISNICQ